MQIKNKEQMYAMLAAGLFGNTFRVWPSVDIAVLNGYNGLFHIRSMVKGGPLYADPLSTEMAKAITDVLDKTGVKYIVYEFVPNHRIILHAEAQMIWGVLHLRYKFQAGLMRDAMWDCEHAEGPKAWEILRQACSWYQKDRIKMLLDTYDGYGLESAVVEFSCFDCAVGTEADNVIIWEVRSY